MLKIKEDKMQELEKLGFVKCETSKGCIYYYHFYQKLGSYISLIVNMDRTLTLDINCEEDWTDELDIFWELFANDMVEKDGEQNER